MLNKTKIENFTCFKEAELSFSKGLNVIVGENGTGKSHLLKLGYSTLSALYDYKEKKDEKQSIKFRFSGKVTEKKIDTTIESIFFPTFENNFKASIFSDLISNTDEREKGMSLEIDFANRGFFSSYVDARIYSTGIEGEYEPDFNVEIEKFTFDEVTHPPLFFPVKEIISVYEGFGASLRKRELGFDKTYLNFSDALALKPLSSIENASIQECIALLETSINGYTVELQNDTFYFRKKSKGQHNKEIPAMLFAEGHNKLGTLSYLMRNGSIQENMTLFWDEPEANMNPRLLKILAEVLVTMSEHMQIILSTHSLFLLREIDIVSKQHKLSHPIMFTGLHLQDDQSVQVIQSEKISEIGDITALDAAIEQSNRFMKSRID